MTHHETSCGLVDPIAAVCEVARRHGARTFVDATSSAGVEDLDVTRDRDDACVTSWESACMARREYAWPACGANRWQRGATASRAPFHWTCAATTSGFEANSQTPQVPAPPSRYSLRSTGRRGTASSRGSGRGDIDDASTAGAGFESGLASLGLPLLQLPSGSEACSRSSRSILLQRSVSMRCTACCVSAVTSSTAPSRRWHRALPGRRHGQLLADADIWVSSLPSARCCTVRRSSTAPRRPDAPFRPRASGTADVQVPSTGRCSATGVTCCAFSFGSRLRRSTPRALSALWLRDAATLRHRPPAGVAVRGHGARGVRARSVDLRQDR